MKKYKSYQIHNYIKFVLETFLSNIHRIIKKNNLGQFGYQTACNKKIPYLLKPVVYEI